MTTKQCRKCGISKSLDDFHKSKTGSQGVRGRCKTCTKEDAGKRRPLSLIPPFTPRYDLNSDRIAAYRAEMNKVGQSYAKRVSLRKRNAQ